MADRALPSGVVTPLVVFRTDDGAPYRAATKALVEHQLAAGVHGLLVNGSTGELGHLVTAERSAVLRAVVEAAAGRVPVWAGVAGLGTTDAVTAAREAEAGGADAALVLPPLFFDTSDAELAEHFRRVAAAIGMPVLAYDVPVRAPRKLPVSLLVGLSVAVIATCIGLVLGAVAGYFRGWVDGFLSRIADVVLSFPTLIIVIIVVAFVGPSVTALILGIGLFNSPIAFRIVRGLTLSLREQDGIQAVSGAGRRPGPRPAQTRGALRRRAAHRRGDAGGGSGHPAGGGAVVHRSRRSAADRELGEHAQRGTVAHYPGVDAMALAAAVQRHRGDGPGRELRGRRTARRRRSEGGPMTEPLLSIEDLVTEFRVEGGTVPAVSGAGYQVMPGETLGVVGESGSGKSVTVASVLGLLPSSGRVVSGTARFAGRDLLTMRERELEQVRGRDIGLVFQDPMTALNPVMTIGEQIAESLRRHSPVSRRAAAAKVTELLAEVGIPSPEERARQYPHQFSGRCRAERPALEPRTPGGAGTACHFADETSSTSKSISGKAAS